MHMASPTACPCLCLKILFESSGKYYLWVRDGNNLVRILHDLEEIKQIITDWGQGALSMEYMGPV